jgi:hypothetical protein
VAVGGFNCLLDARGLASLLALIKEPLVRQGEKRLRFATLQPENQAIAQWANKKNVFILIKGMMFAITLQSF